MSRGRKNVYSYTDVNIQNGPLNISIFSLSRHPPQTAGQQLGSRLAWALPNTSALAPTSRAPLGPPPLSTRAPRPRHDGDLTGELGVGTDIVGMYKPTFCVWNYMA